MDHIDFLDESIAELHAAVVEHLGIPARRADAETLGRHVRGHWGIEVRHEAPWNRAEMKGLRLRAVAAAR